MRKKAHIAVHISNRKGNTFSVTVIQPRNSLGQFMTPSARISNRKGNTFAVTVIQPRNSLGQFMARAIISITSGHSTLDGKVVRKGYLTQ